MVLCLQAVCLITHVHSLFLHFLPQPVFPSELATYLSRRIYVFFFLVLISGHFPCFYAHIQVPSNPDSMSRETLDCTLSYWCPVMLFMGGKPSCPFQKEAIVCFSHVPNLNREGPRPKGTLKRSGCIVLTKPESQFMLLNNCNSRFLSLSLA